MANIIQAFPTGAGGSGTTDYADLTNKPSINNVELSGAKTGSDLKLQNETLATAVKIAGVNRTKVQTALTALGTAVNPKEFTAWGSGTINSTNYVDISSTVVLYATWEAGHDYSPKPGFPLPFSWNYPLADIFYLVSMTRNEDDTFIDYICYAFFTRSSKSYVKHYARRATKTNNTWTYPDWIEVGGTEYTAGDGIDMTNNVISTDNMPAADMSEIVTPLPSVMSRRMKYSTEEQVVGEWIDGKPIYQKTFTGTTPSPAGGISMNINISSLSIDEVINLNGIINWYNAPSYGQINMTMTSGGYCQTLFTRSDTIEYVCDSGFATDSSGIFKNQPYKITIQYTKTTD